MTSTDSTTTYWLQEIDRALMQEDSWRERSKKIIARYRDERPAHETGARFNILWSNIETLNPALYANTPKPVIERRFKDKDVAALQASLLLERALETEMEADDFDAIMRRIVQDYLLCGRGVARVQYKYKAEGVPEFITSERACLTPVYWEDFLMAPSRRFDETSWVAFRSYLSRDQLTGRFGVEKANQAKLDWKPAGDETGLDLEKSGKAVVWEIWDKDAKQVHWLAPNSKLLLDSQDDPLRLDGFFPCPAPLLANVTNDSMIPIPDFVQYQDQALELDILTARISALAKVIRLRGVYDASAEPLSRLLSEYLDENELIPVEQWSTLTQKGGLDGVLAWLPIERMVQVLNQLYAARERIKQDLYEVTGIADVLRGASHPSETATAQQIKTRFASLRLEQRQLAVARFARDCLRLKAQVIAEHFADITLSAMTGLPVAPEVMMLLRQNQLRDYRIDIETDSTIAVDEQLEKRSRTEFLGAITSFLKEIAPLVSQGIVPLGIAKEMLLMGMRGYRIARQLEDTVDEFVSAAAPPQVQTSALPVA